MIKQQKIVNLLFEIVKDNLPRQAQSRLKNSPGRRSNFPAKDLVLNSSFLQKICAKVSSGVKLLHLKQLLLLQAAVLHAWVLQLPQLVILPGCQPTPLSPPRSSCPCDSNAQGHKLLLVLPGQGGEEGKCSFEAWLEMLCLVKLNDIEIHGG